LRNERSLQGRRSRPATATSRTSRPMTRPPTAPLSGRPG